MHSILITQLEFFSIFPHLSLHLLARLTSLSSSDALGTGLSLSSTLFLLGTFYPKHPLQCCVKVMCWLPYKEFSQERKIKKTQNVLDNVQIPGLRGGQSSSFHSGSSSFSPEVSNCGRISSSSIAGTSSLSLRPSVDSSLLACSSSSS